MSTDEPEALARARRDAAFREVERGTHEALLALTPVERLEWLTEALDLAYAAGALGRETEPPSPPRSG